MSFFSAQTPAIAEFSCSKMHKCWSGVKPALRAEPCRIHPHLCRAGVSRAGPRAGKVAAGTLVPLLFSIPDFSFAQLLAIINKF